MKWAVAAKRLPLFERIPVRWRIAITTAGLTLLILVVFALVVGQVVGNRIRSDFRDELRSAGRSLAAETRVTGLFDDSDQARDAVEELKDAGFADYRIAVAMQDRADQDSFIAETNVLTAAVQEIPSLPELDSGQVLLLIDAADQAALALEIINRNQGVTGGVRMPT